MKKLTILLLLPLMCGCGIFKNRQVYKTEAKRDSVARTAEQIRSEEKLVDKSTITTTETVDAPVIAKGFKAEVATPLNLAILQHGLTVFEDDRLTVSQALDTLSNILKTSVVVKDRQLTVPYSRQTVEQRDISRESSVSAEKKQETQVKQSEQQKHVKATPNYGWLWVVAAAILVVGVGAYIFRKIF